jgi:integral membrane protein (TIGR01906 family)
MRAIAKWIITLAAPYLVIVGAALLLMQPFLIRYEYGRPGFPPDRYGFTSAERLRLGIIGLKSVTTPGGMRALKDARLSDGRPAFNLREISHMQDVRNLVARLQVLWVALAVLALAATVSLREDARVAWGRGGVLAILVLAALFGATLLDFGDLFVRFHQVFFQSGTWVFPETDTLIRLYPFQFWYDAAVAVGAVAGVTALALTVQWTIRSTRSGK